MTGRRYVEIVWDDAHGGAESAWEQVPDDIQPARIVTVGILTNETAKGYVVTLSYDEMHDAAGSYIFIPKGVVVTIKELRPVRVRRG